MNQGAHNILCNVVWHSIPYEVVVSPKCIGMFYISVVNFTLFF